jgi:hypothetical protein
MKFSNANNPLDAFDHVKTSASLTDSHNFVKRDLRRVFKTCIGIKIWISHEPDTCHEIITIELH